MSIIPVKDLLTHNVYLYKQEIAEKHIKKFMEEIIHRSNYSNQMVFGTSFSSHKKNFSKKWTDDWVDDILKIMCDQFINNGYTFHVESTVPSELSYEITITW
jgi:hypothetical protein